MSSPFTLPPTRTAAFGKGRAVLRSLADEAIFSELSYRYPLKLLSPRTRATRNGLPLGIAYVISYGGGLVSGDKIDLEVEVGSNSALMLLTQGSTKVFKTRAKLTQSALGTNAHDISISPSSSSSSGGPSSSSTTTIVTTQHMVVTLQPSSSILLLPDPVTCFASSSYSQTQTFHLPPIISSSGNASAIILDWFTSGRMARNEEWAFEKYRSCNEIWIGGRRVARDVMLLEQHSPITFTSPSPSPSPSARPESKSESESEFGQTQDPLVKAVGAAPAPSLVARLPPRTLHDRLAPYACYATLFLIGPLASPIISSLSTQFKAIQQMRATKPDRLLWALSPLNLNIPGESIVEGGGNEGAIVRVMGMETELVREWLKRILEPLKNSIGADAYQTAFM